MDNRTHWIFILMVIGSLLLSACCCLSAPESTIRDIPSIEEPTVIEESDIFRSSTATVAVEPEIAEPTATFVFQPGMEVPAESYAYQSPIVGLSMYTAHDGGWLVFHVFAVNPNFGPLLDCQVTVVLYDELGTPLVENSAQMGSIEAYSQSIDMIHFSFIDAPTTPEAYTDYNIFVEATTPHGETLMAQLSDQPVSGDAGETISQEMWPQYTASVEVDLSLPADGYSPGMIMEAQMTGSFMPGEYQVDEGLSACLRVTELRQYATGQKGTITLAETCEQVSLNELQEDMHLDFVQLAFEPSGFAFLSKESPVGTYAPLELRAHAYLTYHNMLIDKATDMLFLLPFEINDTWWECGGNPTTGYHSGESCVARITLRSLVDDSQIHSVHLSARHMEQDLAGWLISALFAFLPCLAGECEEEIVTHMKADELLLSADEEFEFSLPIELPIYPTEEITIGYTCYMGLSIDGVTVWRGAELKPIIDS